MPAVTRAESFESLKIPAAKKKYILETLEPILEPMVAEVLSTLPADPVSFMIEYLTKLKKSQTISGDTSEPDEDDDFDEDEDLTVEELPPPVRNMDKARKSVSAEVYGLWNIKKEFTAPFFQKTDQQRERISGVLKKSFLFQSLEEKEIAIVINAMNEVVVGPKTRLIQQGDDGDFLFVIEQGILDCYKLIDGNEKLVKTVQAGDAFGELSLLYNVPRAASVESRTDCVLWKLDRETFNHIVKDSASQKRERYEEFLKSVPILRSIDAYERSQIADALRIENCKAGVSIVKQGELGNQFYLLEEGTCEALKDGLKVMDYKAGDYFGELALLTDEPRAASIVSTSECKLLVLDRHGFKRLLGPLQSILETRKYQ
jgi:cAMP-dependent protein kinase regulator